MKQEQAVYRGEGQVHSLFPQTLRLVLSSRRGCSMISDGVHSLLWLRREGTADVSSVAVFFK